jgi:hypothetical protein
MAPKAHRKTRSTLPLLLTALSALASCGSSLDEAVQSRAADDFECTPDAVDVEEIGRSRYHARGCGKDGDYICSQTPDGVDCSLDSDLDVESPSTLAPAPSATVSAPAPAATP